MAAEENNKRRKKAKRRTISVSSSDSSLTAVPETNSAKIEELENNVVSSNQETNP